MHRHSREGGNLENELQDAGFSWIPAFAGMTFVFKRTVGVVQKILP